MNRSNLRVNGSRLWGRLMEMAEIGGTDAGGCNRQALTDEDKAGRELFISWCRTAGCEVEADQMGNLFARREGRDSTLPPVLIGSHLDTQPTGGKFDGVYGVLAGLEIIESLNDQDVQTVHPIDVVAWTNEEGARFSPAMIGSGVFAGAFELDYGLSRPAKDGVTIGDELRRIGFAGSRPCKATPIKAAFEAHIEQGPVLEAEKIQIGVVTGVQGMRWFDIEINGDPVHAGPTPMDRRRDPFMALHVIIERLYAMVANYAPQSRVTFGDIQATPGARNTVPEKVVLAIDIRHPQEEVLAKIDDAMRSIVKEACAEKGLGSNVREEWQSEAIQFDAGCVSAVRSATELLGIDAMDIVSGAGHDSVYVSRVAPTSMIFVPCEGGISHNESESAEPDDLAAGCNVLLHAVLRMSDAEK